MTVVTVLTVVTAVTAVTVVTVVTVVIIVTVMREETKNYGVFFLFIFSKIVTNPTNQMGTKPEKSNCDKT